MKKRLAKTFSSKDIVPFMGIMFSFGLAFGFIHSSSSNYLYNVLNFNEADRGILEALRETPGLLLMFIIALFASVSENRIMRHALFICMIGMGGLVMFPEMRYSAIFCIVIWSLGEHLLMPLRRSITTHAAHPGKEAYALGLVHSVAVGGHLLGFTLTAAFFLILREFFKDFPELESYRIIFIATFCAALMGFVLSFFLQKTKQHVKRSRLLIERRFSKYYILELFYGARKQIFLTFAPFAIVKVYGKGPEVLAILFTISAIINIFAAPMIGKLIDRLGYRAIMIYDTVILFFVCLSYGFAQRLAGGDMDTAFLIVATTFILDWILSNGSMATNSYVRMLCGDDKQKMTSCVSTGISVNHLISVLVALAGGFIWEFFGLEVLFSLAALMAVGNTLFALTVPKPEKSPTQ